ncbi:DUF4397 domain-containing protein [Granulicella aggregans]|uniref:DUF4397 domain-containing protein n=1 Tax=Granulicella aggregans TaxID=474949 RepID=UPI0021E04808|nr:DUF4397 domain-containing protein [Granulicella aggregans]
MPVSQVRIIDTSADAPDLDIYQGDAALAYNLGFGTVSSYVSISPGASTVSAHAAGTKQMLSSFHGSFTASGHYTVLLSGGPTGTISETVLADQSVAAPAGMASVRVLDQARRGTGDVDVYLVRAGSTLAESRPFITNSGFGENGSYMNVPAGAYKVVVVAAGTTVPIYSGATVTYGSGSARTLVVLDSQRIDGQKVQVVTAEDFDPGAMVE